MKRRGWSVPWLLVAVTGHKGSGALEHGYDDTESDIVGGLVDPARSCDASSSGGGARVRIRRIIISMRRDLEPRWATNIPALHERRQRYALKDQTLELFRDVSPPNAAQGLGA